MPFLDGTQKTVTDVIRSCTQLIEQEAMVAGVGNRMQSPLLSVFLGRDAISHISEVRSAYFSCWSSEARKLTELSGTYGPEEMDAKITAACKTDGSYVTKNKLRIAWYWDIMDDAFETHFAAIQQPVSTPPGMQVMKNFFIFCSQQDMQSREKTKARLQRLIAWNAQQRETMLVLSDVTQEGLLDRCGIVENYRIAANTILMMNSVPNQIGAALDFKMRQEPLWTASYYVCSKNFFDIIGVSLLRIIENYWQLGSNSGGSNSAQAKICDGGNYLTFLDNVFQECLEPLCPDEQHISFWEDLPYTQDMQALETELLESEGRGGLFGRLFRRKSGNADNAIGSVGDFWGATVDRYYVQPVQEWMQSPEGSRKISDYIYGKLTSSLKLNDMQTQLPEEWRKVDAQAQNLTQPQRQAGVPLSVYLHKCACVELKSRIYATLLETISAIMRKLYQNSNGFQKMLSSVETSLRGIAFDPSIEQAYGTHMNHLIDANRAVLHQTIHPCATEAELLEQLESAFAELVKCDQKQVYFCTLQEDMAFQIDFVGGAANNIINAFFNYDMTKAGRLVTFKTEPGELYCMVNNSLSDIIQGHNIGNPFIVNRCDRIERLYLYPVQPEQIRYS